MVSSSYANENIGTRLTRIYKDFFYEISLIRVIRVLLYFLCSFIFHYSV